MNAYETLGVSPSASQEEIDRAYLEKYERYSLFQTPSNLTKFLEINAAWALLSNPDTRNAVNQHAGDVPMVRSAARRASVEPRTILHPAGHASQTRRTWQVRPPAEERPASEPSQHFYHHHYHHSSPGGAELLAHTLIALGILGVFLLPFLL